MDGLRALSIALVFLEHGTFAWHYTGGFLGVIVGDVGSVGVDVFFAISGFLITLLLIRELRASESISLKAFYTRRFLRLMPAALVFMATVFALQLAGRVYLSPRNWAHVITYTANFDPNPAWETGHLWSLSIEEQFYLLWPVALVLLGPRLVGTLAFGWLLGAPVLRFVMLQMHPHDMGRFEYWTPMRVDCIAAGCVLALVCGNETFRRYTRMTRPMAMLTIAVAAFTVVASYILGYQISLYGVTIGPSVRAAAIVAIIWLSANHAASGWGRFLDARPVVIVGILSYSLYLWQQLFLGPRERASALDVAARVAMAVLAGVASYLLVERPFLKLKDRTAKRVA